MSETVFAAPLLSPLAWRLIWIAHAFLMACMLHLPWAKSATPSPYQADKVFHFTSYAILAWLGVVSLSLSGRRHLPRVNLSAGQYRAWFLILVVLAAVDEVTQPLTGRTMSMWDFVADLLGIMTGLWASRQTSLIVLGRNRDL
ncbi:MAG: VanZ family protein [Phycisphaerae bacterium]